MPRRPTAVLDANVLFPFQLRNLLLHLAVGGLYEPLWSAEIVEECVRNLRKSAGMSEEQCAHLVTQMRTYFPDAWGSGYAGRVDALALPDEGDRHVVALAVQYEAEFIITRNLKHFPLKVLRPVGIEAVDPDFFLELLWDCDSESVVQAAERHRLSIKRNPLTPADYLVSLRGHAGLPRTAKLLTEAGFLDPH